MSNNWLGENKKKKVEKAKKKQRNDLLVAARWSRRNHSQSQLSFSDSSQSKMEVKALKLPFIFKILI